MTKKNNEKKFKLIGQVAVIFIIFFAVLLARSWAIKQADPFSATRSAVTFMRILLLVLATVLWTIESVTNRRIFSPTPFLIVVALIIGLLSFLPYKLTTNIPANCYVFNRQKGTVQKYFPEATSLWSKDLIAQNYEVFSCNEYNSSVISPKIYFANPSGMVKVWQATVYLKTASGKSACRVRLLDKWSQNMRKIVFDSLASEYYFQKFYSPKDEKLQKDFSREIGEGINFQLRKRGWKFVKAEFSVEDLENY